MITTFSVKEIDPLNVDVDLVLIEDVAHSLALINRFNGHSRYPLPVAQHAWWVSMLLEGTGHELQGLHHDDTEYVLGDVTKWFKQTPEMKGYRYLEDKLQRQLFKHWGCESELHPDVEWADRLMVRFEVTKAFGPDYVIDHPDYPPLCEQERKLLQDWAPWGWGTAERRYLIRHLQLAGRAR